MVRSSRYSAAAPALAARLTTRVITQRLRAESGRLSTIATVSPTCESFCSSCAMNVEVSRWAFPYVSCRTWRSTATTRLFAILSRTTTPVSSVLAAIRFLPFFRQDRHHPRQLAPERAHLVRGVQLAHRLLDPQPEDLVLQVLDLALQLVDVQLADLLHLHLPPSPRRTASRTAS